MKGARRASFRRIRRGLLLTLPTALLPRSLAAQVVVAVPVPLQMELLVKVASYDKNLPARAAVAARVLILVKSGDPQSSHVAQTAKLALQGKTLNRLAVETSEVVFSDGPGVAQSIKEKGAAILYAAPGFDPNDMQSVARSLRGVSVLSAGSLARFVETGMVLGFDLVGGKPKLLVHLRRARDQGVDLSSQVLKLAKVIE
jgi:hypothetical protein